MWKICCNISIWYYSSWIFYNFYHLYVICRLFPPSKLFKNQKTTLSTIFLFFFFWYYSLQPWLYQFNDNFTNKSHLVLLKKKKHWFGLLLQTSGRLFLIQSNTETKYKRFDHLQNKIDKSLDSELFTKINKFKM